MGENWLLPLVSGSHHRPTHIVRYDDAYMYVYIQMYILYVPFIQNFVNAPCLHLVILAFKLAIIALTNIDAQLR